MAGSLPARLTPAEGRKFGLMVGAAFVALALVLWWRGAETARTVLAVVGGTLIVAGLLIPGRLGPVYRGWMRMALAISRVTTPILMGVIFFLVITPMGIARRLLRRNALIRREGSPDLAPGGFWVVRGAGGRRGDLQRQY